MCGPVSYNVTVIPSHGMVMRVNDTTYNITGLYYDTNYTIIVYATNSVGDGIPATVTVRTLPGSYVVTQTNAYIDILCICIVLHLCEHRIDLYACMHA